MSSKEITLDMARAAKRRALELLAEQQPDASVGITQVRGGYGLKVNLKTPLADDTKLPAKIENVPIVVEVVGPIRKR